MRGLLRLGGAQSSSIETNGAGRAYAVSLDRRAISRRLGGGAVQGRSGAQGRADTPQVHPCRLAVAIHGDTTVGTTLHPRTPGELRAAGNKTRSGSMSLPLRWDAPDTTV